MAIWCAFPLHGRRPKAGGKFLPRRKTNKAREHARARTRTHARGRMRVQIHTHTQIKPLTRTQKRHVDARNKGAKSVSRGKTGRGHRGKCGRAKNDTRRTANVSARTRIVSAPPPPPYPTTDERQCPATLGGGKAHEGYACQTSWGLPNQLGHASASPPQYLLMPKKRTPCSWGSLGMRTLSRDTVFTAK